MNKQSSYGNSLEDSNIPLKKCQNYIKPNVNKKALQISLEQIWLEKMPCHPHLVDGRNKALQADFCDSEMIKLN